ncbi:uncharacterized protein MYCFIDRAFT_209103 [Pseudocercospora fijiensis CIRAD86]|uniref:Uncharacterized protein n=1 Tax=Pseudocercospora fijiensis (strain CIRAD86) TaxID=383855 RepID=M3A2Z2_PSEFD|nr:uncharacterized protein MYCFIDRAFT_209103 [Pseudocercospora fijiensis CIRAD86]EME78936.1 hypothetical protein MYCFIDRAFT_209103 [Pseudocercospora fijiensis CIRAD86]
MSSCLTCAAKSHQKWNERSSHNHLPRPFPSPLIDLNLPPLLAIRPTSARDEMDTTPSRPHTNRTTRARTNQRIYAIFSSGTLPDLLYHHSTKRAWNTRSGRMIVTLCTSTELQVIRAGHTFSQHYKASNMSVTPTRPALELNPELRLSRS